MSLRTDRQKTKDAVIQGRFIEMVLGKSGTELDGDIKKRMSGFSSAFWSQRNFSVQNNTLVYTQKKVHRFVDMKTRVKNGSVNKKKNHPIHNKPIFGHLNNIVRELAFGFSDAVKNDLYQLDNTNI